MEATPLPRDFYQPSALAVARNLLGTRLVRILPDGSRIVGRIVETEAYTGRDDLASHGRTKRTKRNAIMYGPPGKAYIYLIYGMYWMLNIVVEPEDQQDLRLDGVLGRNEPERVYAVLGDQQQGLLLRPLVVDWGGRRSFKTPPTSPGSDSH